MKKIFFIITLMIFSLVKAQSTRNDAYTSLGIITNFKEIPFGISLYNVIKDKKFGFFTELKLNRLSFDKDYIFIGYAEASDVLRNARFDGNKSMIKMINIGTVFNPQELGILSWDIVDIDLCIGLGYIQEFRYNFYYDTQGIEENENQSASNPLGKYYVISYNNHGVNLNFGTNLSFQRIPFIIHIGYDLKPNAWALGFNWKIK
tara:strand:- start:1249 stop:1860 length:612 start_codon:yes stop_codon:yes gene_type:complete